MKASDLTPAQRIILKSADPATGIVHVREGHAIAYTRAARAGLIKKVHGITYKVTADGDRLRKQIS